MISLLKDDLDGYLKGWKENVAATEAQQLKWPQNQKISRKLLGKDENNSLRLLIEDGGDGKTVGSVTANTARCFFWDADGSTRHVFPPDKDLIRLGKFLHLGLYATLALVLKAQWELFFSKIKDCEKKPDYRSLFEMLKNDVEDAKKYSLDFNLGQNKRLGINELFDELEKIGNMVSEEGHDQNSFESLIHQMILDNVHLISPDSDEFKAFIKRQEKEVNLLKGASDELAETFWLKKCIYHECESELGRLLLDRENIRLENANINNKWLSIFGEFYLPLKELEYQYYALQRRIQLIEELGPQITPEELFDIENQKLREEERKIQKLKEAIAFAQLPDIEGITASEEQISAYEAEALKVLREIWKLTHEDVINTEKFTEKQKRQLRGYFDQVMEIRSSEKGLIKRSLSVLLDILAKAKSIWEYMGLEVRAESIIAGETLQDQIAWLDNRISSLEVQIQNLRNELLNMINDKDIKEKHACLSSDEQIEKIKVQMKDRTVVFQKEIQNLKKSIQPEFLFEENS